MSIRPADHARAALSTPTTVAGFVRHVQRLAARRQWVAVIVDYGDHPIRLDAYRGDDHIAVCPFPAHRLTTAQADAVIAIARTGARVVFLDPARPELAERFF